jgi:phenylacetate-CoA ligase
MYWEKEIECMERKELTELQLKKLQATIARVYANVPFYRERFAPFAVYFKK